MSDSLTHKKPERTRAVALHYKESDQLPHVIASGTDEVARQIIQTAIDNNIPIQQDDVLSEMLSKLGAGSAISSESFRLVAEIISFLYHSDKEWHDNHPGLKPLLGTVSDHSEFKAGILPEKTPELKRK